MDLDDDMRIEIAKELKIEKKLQTQSTQTIYLLNALTDDISIYELEDLTDQIIQ